MRNIGGNVLKIQDFQKIGSLGQQPHLTSKSTGLSTACFARCFGRYTSRSMKHFLLLTIIVLAGCETELESTSVISIVANPQKYHGNTVRISGYFTNEFENQAIHFNKAAEEFYLPENAIWVEFAQKIDMAPYTWSCEEQAKVTELGYFNHRYVLIEGTFDATSHGHMGAYSGTINNVYRILAKSSNLEKEPNKKCI